MILRVLKKVGPSENNDFNCTNLTGTVLVPRIAEIIKANTISDFLEERSIEMSIGSSSASSADQDTNISYVDYYRRQLCHKGISQQTSLLISSLRRGGSISNYQSSWKKWPNWFIVSGWIKKTLP